MQRCQLHERRNVAGHLTEKYREEADRKMAAAYQMSSGDCALRERARRQCERDADEIRRCHRADDTATAGGYLEAVLGSGHSGKINAIGAVAARRPSTAASTLTIARPACA